MKPPRQPRPRALRVRTPEEQRVIAAAIRSGDVWMAFGPEAGACGHRHLSPVTARRCASKHRPFVGRLRRPGLGAWSAPAPGSLRSPPRAPASFRAWDALTILVLVLVALAAWQVW